MIVEGLDGAFGPVAAMKASWGELIFDGLGSHEVTEELGSFIVEAMETWLEAASLEQTKYFFICCFD